MAENSEILEHSARNSVKTFWQHWVYTTREGIDRFFRQITLYVKSMVFLLQIQVTRTNDCISVLDKIISRNFDPIMNNKRIINLYVTY